MYRIQKNKLVQIGVILKLLLPSLNLQIQLFNFLLNDLKSDRKTQSIVIKKIIKKFNEKY